MNLEDLQPTAIVAKYLHYKSSEGASQMLRRRGIRPIRRGRINLWSLTDIERNLREGHASSPAMQTWPYKDVMVNGVLWEKMK